MKADLVSFKYQLDELKRLVFGSRSERFLFNEDQTQLPLFGAPEETIKTEEEIQSISYERKQKAKEKQHPIRTLLPAHLPREEEVIEPEQLEDGMKKIGEEVTELLEHIPGKLYVRRIVRPKYASKNNDCVKIAELPSLPIPKGNAGAGLLAYLQVSKFVDHLPFYRQVQMFKRDDVNLAESTINGWFKASCKLLEPLYDTLLEQIKKQNYLQADESPIAVQSSQKPGATHTGYHWVYHAPLIKLAVFDYQPSRSGKSPREFLKHFSGYLQTDGYAAYNELGKREDITLLACLAHARRYFDKALDNDKASAEYALKAIQSLYAIERELKDQEASKQEIEATRKEDSLPILDNLKKWLDQQQLASTPKSPIGKAVNYTLGLWSRLTRYVENGDLLIDNNSIENLIRPLALGRKNYLFAGSHDAAQCAAMMYSFFATCKLNEVNPHTWLKSVLHQISETAVNNLDHLLPHKWSNDQ
ncbi:MAG: IS66 family transposase [Reichenbachiella sp.]